MQKESTYEMASTLKIENVSKRHDKENSDCFSKFNVPDIVVQAASSTGTKHEPNTYVTLLLKRCLNFNSLRKKF